MNLNLTGNHLEITPAIRDYVVAKLDRITRHFDHVIDVQVVMSVAKLRHKCEVNLHARGKDIHVEAVELDMYAAIDMLVDKLDRFDVDVLAARMQVDLALVPKLGHRHHDLDVDHVIEVTRDPPHLVLHVAADRGGDVEVISGQFEVHLFSP